VGRAAATSTACPSRRGPGRAVPDGHRLGRRVRGGRRGAGTQRRRGPVPHRPTRRDERGVPRVRPRQRVHHRGRAVRLVIRLPGSGGRVGRRCGPGHRRRRAVVVGCPGSGLVPAGGAVVRSRRLGGPTCRGPMPARTPSGRASDFRRRRSGRKRPGAVMRVVATRRATNSNRTANAAGMSGRGRSRTRTSPRTGTTARRPSTRSRRTATGKRVQLEMGARTRPS